MRNLWLSTLILLAACGAVAAPDGDDDAGDDVADAAATADAPVGMIDAMVVGDCAPACGMNQFCETVPGLCGGPGMCMQMPFGCPDLIFQPVCGCDGMTYGNDCDRRAAGVSLHHDGECQLDCAESPATPGCCYDNGDCGADQRCYTETCGTAEGVCARIPDAGMCWENADCAPGKVCNGAQLCPCGATCIFPDMPGVCG